MKKEENIKQPCSSTKRHMHVPRLIRMCPLHSSFVVGILLIQITSSKVISSLLTSFHQQVASPPFSDQLPSTSPIINLRESPQANISSSPTTEDDDGVNRKKSRFASHHVGTEPMTTHLLSIKSYT